MKNINYKSLVPYIGLAAIAIIFTAGSGGQLLTGDNLLGLFETLFVYLIGALGCIFVYSIGALDFSIGSVLGVTATVAGLVTQATGNLFLAFVAAMAIGAATGALIGTLHNIFGLFPFIVSVTVMFAFRGLTWELNNRNGGSVGIPTSLYVYDNYVFKLIVVIVVLAFIFVLFRYTKLGRQAKAIGSNEMAALQSGIPVKKIKLLAFMFSGMFAGLAGVLTLIKARASFTLTGQMFECNVLIVMLLGGMPLSGGSNAKFKAPIIGALSYAILSNGLVLIGVPAELQQGIKGLVLIIIVALSFDRSSAAVID